MTSYTFSTDKLRVLLLSQDKSFYAASKRLGVSEARLYQILSGKHQPAASFFGTLLAHYPRMHLNQLFCRTQ